MGDSLHKEALRALDRLEGRIADMEYARSEPIAIVGMGCRFPGGVHDPESYWQLLLDGVDAIGPVPAGRWDTDALFDADPDAPGKLYVREGGFLDDIDRFDAAFFGISAREAISLDPQQRLLLETTWQALEHAGISADSMANSRTGVYVGVMENDYAKLLRDNGADDLDAYYVTGNHFSFTAGRISYVLGLHGPAVALDTACSSSLVAIHLACQSLRGRETDVALAGGVNVLLSPELTITMCKFHALSPDGRCKTFDASADGFGQGEGCGMIVLKRLSDAVTDGDNVIAVIRGSAVNHDGPSGGLTVPSSQAQRTVVGEALANAGLDPNAIGFVEAHGTGTSLGDPIELRALGEVFAPSRAAERPLVVGSVKTNIGHLESAAGVAGVIKVALALEHGLIPPHLHLNELNPRISLDELAMAVPTSTMKWPEGEGPRAAGISSFGLSGTNAHIVLEQAPEAVVEATPPAHGPNLLVLSASSDEALKDVASRYADALRGLDDGALADALWVAANGRSHRDHRLAVVTTSSEDIADRLGDFAVGTSTEGFQIGVSREPSDGVAFLFTGQGAQYVGMGRGLYEQQPVFRAALEACDEIMRGQRGSSLLDVMFEDESEHPLVDHTEWTQPALFALEYSLARLWQSWGVEPAVVLGHSVGEYAAACIAGVFSLEDGLGLIAARGRLMGALPRDGAMTVVFAPLERVQAALGDHGDKVAVAAVNGPESVVISGEQRAVAEVAEMLEAAGVRCRPLNVSHAFHSPLMDPMLDEFERTAGRATFHHGQIPIVSNVSGEIVGPDQLLDARYWREHVRQPVRFADGIAALHAQGQRTFLEIGPNPTLLGMARQCIPLDGDPNLIPSLRGPGDDVAHALEALGALHVAGHAVDWEAFHGRRPGARGRVSLPTYPFQRERFWLERNPHRPRVLRSSEEVHPLLGARVSSPLEQVQFEAEVTVDTLPYLQDHRIAGAVVVPATAFVEMGLQAACTVSAGDGHELVDLFIREALLIEDHGESTVVQSILDPDPAAQDLAFRVTSRHDDEWKTHVTARLRAGHQGDAVEQLDLAAARTRCREALDTDAFYSRVHGVGLEYGPAFRGIAELWRGDGELVAALRPAPQGAPAGQGPSIDPATVDAALQLVHGLVGDHLTTVYLPVAIERIAVHGRVPDRPWAHLIARPRQSSDAGELVADVRLTDESGRVAVEIDGLRVRRASRGTLARLARPKLEDWVYEVAWREAPQPKPDPRSNPRTWVVIDEGDDLGARLREPLEALGQRFVALSTGGALDGHELDLSHPEGARAALIRAVGDGEPLVGVVYIAGSVEAAPDVDVTCVPLHILQALDAVAGAGRPRLWLATRGSQPVGPDPCVVSPAQAPVWGLGAVASSERPDIDCIRLDLDPWPETDGDEEAAALVRELVAPVQETQIAHRRGRRHVARLVRSRLEDRTDGSLSAPDGPFCVDVGSPGLLDSLELTPMPRPVPGPGEIEIEVRATGLNFKDVLKALGKYPLTESPLGDECAGVVAAIGPGVDRFAPGDRVVAMAYGSFRSHVVTPAALAVRLPGTMDFADAAVVPIAYLTARESLLGLGLLAEGQRVLIHAATGGVGLWAVQLAKHAGAEVYATAGSPRKRALLRSMGVSHVYDSRTLAFADAVLEETRGEGVDLVLNSLAGDYIPQTLRVLRPGGTFVEIGRTQVWTAEQVADLRPDVGYHVFYLADRAASEPDHVTSMLTEGIAALDAGTYSPLPVRRFALDDVEDAFRYMSQSRHVGKIAVVRPDRPRSPEGTTMDSDGSYLVTGGLGGLGLEVAKWLIDQGARTLVLVGRSGATGDAIEGVRGLEALGARVEVRRVDVADAEAVRRLGEEIVAELPPLRGIVHAAAVLDDGILGHQTRERFERVFGPKAQGAWNLHQMSLDMELDFFVAFSSWAALVGLPGQGSYVAANAYLDALAHHRDDLGLPGLSINWGAWAAVGMAASMADADRQRLADMGVTAFDPEWGTVAMGQLLRQPTAQAAVLAIDWSKWFAYQRWSSEVPFFAELAGEVTLRSQAAPAAVRRDLGAVDPEERRRLVQEELAALAARVLRVPVANVDVSRPLVDLGLDSLMTTELFAAIEHTFGKVLPLATLIERPTVAALAELLAGDEPAVGWDSLVPVQPEGSRLPVFFVHAEEGNVLFYRALATRLGADQPLYGLQARNLDGSASDPGEIVDIAADYVAEIRTVQPSGPYNLGGFCLGGAIALEMARQLRAAGDEVAPVVMIQTEHHDYIDAGRATLRRRLLHRPMDRLAYELSEITRLDGPQRSRYLSRKARGLVEIARVNVSGDPGVEGDRPQRGVHTRAVASTYRAAFWRYRPLPYDGPSLVVRAAAQPRGLPDDPLLGWGPVLQGDVEAVTIEGAHHRTIMHEPAIGAVASVIEAALATSSEPTGAEERAPAPAPVDVPVA